MIVDYKNWRFRLHCSLKKYVEVEGINSVLPNGQHILMWDFDDTPLEKITESLLKIQSDWDLSHIYIVQSSSEHYHAYCLELFSLGQAMHILADTKYIDLMYLKLGVVRGYWTLRISPEKGKFQLVETLISRHRNVKNIQDLKTVEYRTEV